MASVSNSFSAVGVGTNLLIAQGNSLTFNLAGGATATFNIEVTYNNGVSWNILGTFTADTGPTTIVNNGISKARYRWNCTARSSGTSVGTIKDATEELIGVGTVSASTVVAYEHGGVAARKTVLELNNFAIAITDDANVAQYGGAQVYDFPEAMLMIKGCRIDGILTAGVTGTVIDNWDGLVALGTVTATTGATLTSTEADIMQSVAVSAGASDKLGVVNAVQVATLLTESGARWLNGTATAINMFLNFVIDDDASHGASTALFTGTIEFNWESFGDT